MVIDKFRDLISINMRSNCWGPVKALSGTLEILGNLKLSRLIFVAISFRFFVKRVNH